MIFFTQGAKSQNEKKNTEKVLWSQIDSEGPHEGV